MAEITEPTHHASHTILIADSNEKYSKSLASNLRKAAVRGINFSYTGRQTVRAAATLKPDLILLDHSIQDMDSFATLSNIKYLSPNTLVILLVSFVDTSSLARARELGVDGFYSKSIDQERLIKAVRAILSQDNSSTHSIGSSKQIIHF